MIEDGVIRFVLRYTYRALTTDSRADSFIMQDEASSSRHRHRRSRSRSVSSSSSASSVDTKRASGSKHSYSSSRHHSSHHVSSHRTTSPSSSRDDKKKHRDRRRKDKDRKDKDEGKTERRSVLTGKKVCNAIWIICTILGVGIDVMCAV